MLPYEQKDLVHFESQVWIVSGTGETSTLMSSWWRAGIFRATIILNKCRQIWSCCPQLRQRVLSSWQHVSPHSSQGDLDTFAGLPSCHLIIMKTSHEDHIIIWSSGKGYKSKIMLPHCFYPSLQPFWESKICFLYPCNFLCLTLKRKT